MNPVTPLWKSVSVRYAPASDRARPFVAFGPVERRDGRAWGRAMLGRYASGAEARKAGWQYVRTCRPECVCFA